MVFIDNVRKGSFPNFHKIQEQSKHLLTLNEMKRKQIENQLLQARQSPIFETTSNYFNNSMQFAISKNYSKMLIESNNSDQDVIKLQVK